MALEYKNATGTFPDCQHTESALSQLTAADFPMYKVSVVAQHLDAEDAVLKAMQPMVQTEAQFVRHRTIKRIEHGALDAGSWGSIVGFLGAGVVALAVPGVGPLVLAGAKVASVGLATGDSQQEPFMEPWQVQYSEPRSERIFQTSR